VVLILSANAHVHSCLSIVLAFSMNFLPDHRNNMVNWRPLSYSWRPYTLNEHIPDILWEDVEAAYHFGFTDAELDFAADNNTRAGPETLWEDDLFKYNAEANPFHAFPWSDELWSCAYELHNKAFFKYRGLRLMSLDDVYSPTPVGFLQPSSCGYWPRAYGVPLERFDATGPLNKSTEKVQTWSLPYTAQFLKMVERNASPSEFSIYMARHNKEFCARLQLRFALSKAENAKKRCVADYSMPLNGAACAINKPFTSQVTRRPHAMLLESDPLTHDWEFTEVYRMCGERGCSNVNWLDISKMDHLLCSAHTQLYADGLSACFVDHQPGIANGLQALHWDPLLVLPDGTVMERHQRRHAFSGMIGLQPAETYITTLAFTKAILDSWVDLGYNPHECHSALADDLNFVVKDEANSNVNYYLRRALAILGLLIKNDDDGEGIVSGSYDDFVQLGFKHLKGKAHLPWDRGLMSALSREHFTQNTDYTVHDVQAVRAAGISWQIRNTCPKLTRLLEFMYARGSKQGMANVPLHLVFTGPGRKGMTARMWNEADEVSKAVFQSRHHGFERWDNIFVGEGGLSSRLRRAGVHL
jgi:hypothetical protein